ncbi:MAG: hypothetical protein J6N95_07610 [Bacilli bacterium]|nr:hypothetical protein [Bacilli bacterium]
MASILKEKINDQFYDAELVDPVKDISGVLPDEKEIPTRLVKIFGNGKYLCVAYKKSHGSYYTCTITKPDITVEISSNNYSAKDILGHPVAAFIDPKSDCLFTIKGEKGTQYFQTFNNLEELIRFINFLDNITETTYDD